MNPRNFRLLPFMLLVFFLTACAKLPDKVQPVNNMALTFSTRQELSTTQSEANEVWLNERQNPTNDI